jgi:phosphoribosylformylglycinamidine cyclo-ligase
MRRTFNLGIGMILIVDPARQQEVLAMLTAGGESAFKIGILRDA